MNFAEYVQGLQADPEYRGQVAHVERIARRSAEYASPVEPIRPDLSARLRELGIDRLYTHQAQALDAVRQGDTVVVVTATASGKTLCYNLPTLEAVLSNPRS